MSIPFDVVVMYALATVGLAFITFLIVDIALLARYERQKRQRIEKEIEKDRWGRM